MAAKRSSPDLVFVWVPKNAGTSIVQALAPHGLRSFLSVDEIKAGWDGRGMVTFGHLHYGQLHNLGLIPEDFFKNAIRVAVVRNPYDRLISLYEYHRSMGIVRMCETFRRYISILENRINPVGVHAHWGRSQANPQVEWMLPGMCLLRFERLQADFNALCAKLGLPRTALPWRNQTKRGGLLHYYSSTALVKRARALYRRDFDEFAYPTKLSGAANAA